MHIRQHNYSLFLKREHYNHEQKNVLEQKGFRWERIENWGRLRSFDGKTVPSTFSCETLPSLRDLQLKTKDDITSIVRTSFNVEPKQPYYNIWNWNQSSASCWQSDTEPQQVISTIAQRLSEGAVSEETLLKCLTERFGKGTALLYRQLVLQYIQNR